MIHYVANFEYQITAQISLANQSVTPNLIKCTHCSYVSIHVFCQKISAVCRSHNDKYGYSHYSGMSRWQEINKGMYDENLNVVTMVLLQVANKYWLVWDKSLIESLFSI